MFTDQPSRNIQRYLPTRLYGQLVLAKTAHARLYRPQPLSHHFRLCEEEKHNTRNELEEHEG